MGKTKDLKRPRKESRKDESSSSSEDSFEMSDLEQPSDRKVDKANKGSAAKRESKANDKATEK